MESSNVIDETFKFVPRHFDLVQDDIESNGTKHNCHYPVVRKKINYKRSWVTWVKAHYNDPLWGTFGSSIIVHIV
jgi:hypothetical protein